MKKDIASIIRAELKPLADLAKIIPGAYPVVGKTSKDFAIEYEKFIECNHSEKYLISVKLTFKHFLKFFSPVRILNTITLKEIEAFITWLRKSAPKGFVVYFRTLKAAFSKASDWGYITIDNPCKRVKLPRTQINYPEFINELEMLQIADRVENKKIKNAIKFDFYTGLRLGELINLKWKNVDLNRNEIIVGDEKFTTKGKRQRKIPLSEKALKVLAEVKPKGDYKEFSGSFVFGKTPTFKYTGDCISKVFKRACHKVGIDPKIRFHSLRHSFASYLVQQGVSLYVIKDLLGHQTYAVTERYSHLNTQALVAAVAKFN